jgi:hypothetical protein
MNPRGIIFGGIVAIAIIVTIAIVITKKPCEPFPKTANCVCAFDIDHTLSCGNPKPLIDLCKSKGCVLAINTARPTMFIEDIPLRKYDFDYDPSDHYYQPNSYLQTAQQVAESKSQSLLTLFDKYRVSDKKCVILLDDAVWNLETAKAHGFSTVSASDTGECGLQSEKVGTLGDILRRCT